MAKQKELTPVHPGAGELTADVKSESGNHVIKQFTYTVTQEIVKGKLAKYEHLKPIPTGDTESYKAVRSARLDLKNSRTTAKNEHDTAKRPFLEMGNAIDEYFNKIKSAIEPVEKRLQGYEDDYDEEQKRIEERRLDAREQMRKIRLDAAGGAHTMDSYRHWSDEVFEPYLAECVAYNDKKRLEKEESDRIAAENQRKADELNKKEQELADREAALKPLESSSGRRFSTTSLPCDNAAEVSTDGAMDHELTGATDQCDRPSADRQGEADQFTRNNRGRILKIVESAESMKSGVFVGPNAQGLQMAANVILDKFIADLRDLAANAMFFPQ